MSVVMVSDELAAVAAVGEKLVVSPTDWPAAMTVPPAGTPVTPKGAAGVVVDVMVAGPVPVLVTVTGRVWLWPTATLPKAAVDGVAETAAVGGGVVVVVAVVVMVTLLMVCWSVAPPVAAVKAGSTLGGSVTAWSRTVTPSAVTVMRPAVTATVKVWVPVRRGPTAVENEVKVRVSLAPPVVIPT